MTPSKAWKKKANSHTIECDVPVRGDLHLVFYDADKMSAHDKMMGLWLHTSFMPEVCVCIYVSSKFDQCVCMCPLDQILCLFNRELPLVTVEI